MTQQNILELAKQGNPQAIAALLNRNLQPKGITVKVASKPGGVLQVLVEAAQAPDAEQVTAFIRQGMVKLQPAGVRSVMVFGRSIGADMPDWSQEINLVAAPPNQPTAPEVVQAAPVAVAPAPKFTKPTFWEEAAKWTGTILLCLALFLLFFNWVKTVIVIVFALLAFTQCKEMKQAIAAQRKNPAMRQQLKYLEDFEDINPAGKGVIVAIVVAALVFSLFIADLVQNTVGFPAPAMTTSSSSSYSSAPAPASAPVSAPASAPAASTGITMANYNRITTGMSYSEVVEILGQPGEEMSRNELAGMTTVMYMWKNPGGSNMNAIFQNGGLVQKAQFGLP